jgi:ribose transport system ATP-binding protein
MSAETAQPPQGPQPSAPIVLEARRLSKSFGGKPALIEVDLELRAGEIVALLGENGSGKSTLVKILSGYHDPEPGAELEVRGEPIPLPVPLDRFREIGLAFVFQDLGLATRLTVVENLFVGRRVAGAGHGLRAPIRWRRERRAATRIFESYGVSLNPSAVVADLSATHQALLAIIRAAEDLRAFRSDDALGGVLVLDEPTVFLPEHEKVFLYELVRRIAADGIAVLFVSHDMTSVREITSRAVVLRDGRKVGDVMISATGDEALVELVSGHRPRTIESVSRGEAATPTARAEIALAIEGISGGNLQGVDLDLRPGEIVGVAGLLGSGSEDLPYAIFGSLPGAQGTLTCTGWSGEVAKLSPRRAQSLRIALVPAGRLRHGLAPRLSVEKNLVGLVLERYFRHGVLRHRQMRQTAVARGERYVIRPNAPRRELATLSGGNQQKVLLARWLELLPRVLLLHEPTQGVDVATRAEIYEIMRSLCEHGTAILWVTTDFDELAAVAHRIAVCDAGRIVKLVPGPPFSRDRITSEVYAAAAARGSREVPAVG